MNNFKKQFSEKFFVVIYAYDLKMTVFYDDL